MSSETGQPVLSFCVVQFTPCLTVDSGGANLLSPVFLPLFPVTVGLCLPLPFCRLPPAWLADWLLILPTYLSNQDGLVATDDSQNMQFMSNQNGKFPLSNSALPNQALGSLAGQGMPSLSSVRQVRLSIALNKQKKQAVPSKPPGPFSVFHRMSWVLLNNLETFGNCEWPLPEMATLL